MKRLFAAAFMAVLALIIVPACTVHVCHKVITECYIECYGTCCDKNYCWECDCHNVCYDECVNEIPADGAH